ncbi:MAG TPA: cytochrome b/b6 domain-containing protein [Geobacterales bacterium]|nr:cytochrome b/b6 domain-containing protein [Geobacterales bacterium]
MTATDFRQTAGDADRTIIVWDWGVRVFHWGLVLCVGVCICTGFLAAPNWLNLHLAAGTVIAGLIVFRLVWGWTGSGYARFSSFAVSAPRLRQHFSDIMKRRRVRHLGHNQAGALMVYALLAVLILLVISGAIALGGAVKQGPLAFALSFAAGRTAREIHELLAFGLLAMIAAHWAGVAFESWRLRENLVRAMFTGRKSDCSASSEAPAPARPAEAATIVLGIAAIAVLGVIALSQIPAKGVPTAPLHPAYVKECGDCHFAYPPSLAPAATWKAVMDGMADHFGENATLDPTKASSIRDWLTANASERWDTRAANMLRRVNVADPQRITSTPGWTRVHEDIPDSVFKSKAVGAKGACKACHSDAETARFDPQSIAIPKEAQP